MSKLLFTILLASVIPAIGCCQDNKESKAWLKTLNEHCIHKATGGHYEHPTNGLALYFTEGGSIRVPYLVYVPKGYDGSAPIPLVVFLHGAILAKDSFQYKDPAVADEPIFSVADPLRSIVVFPFARTDFAWGRNTAANENIMNIIAQVKQMYRVDNKREYIGGISMGGNATYWFVNHKPETFAGFYAFSSMPQTEEGIRFQNITVQKPLYTMNAKDDPGFSYSQVAAIHEAHKQDVPGWHFYSVETGGHRFIYANGGNRYISQLLGEMLSEK